MLPRTWVSREDASIERRIGMNDMGRWGDEEMKCC